MKTTPLLQIVLLAALAVPAAGERMWEWHEEITPETELRRAQRCNGEGTNLLARGLFREAEERIGGGIGTAAGKLRELERRAATVGPLRDFVDRLQAVRNHFDDDWTNAVAEVFALEGPIKSYVATNPIIQSELAWPLRTFDRLQKELDSGNRRDADIQLRNFQDALRRSIGTFEELRRLEPSFRAVLADLERTRKELASVRAGALTAAQLDEIERSILPLRHGYDRHEALAAFASQEGATRDDMSAALVAIVERRPPAAGRADAVREFAISELGIFGGTNALPALRKIALDSNDPCGWHAIGAHFAISGYNPDSLAWTEELLCDARPELAARRAAFLNVFRHALSGDDAPADERAFLAGFVFRATAVADDSPAWTDQVLCRSFPDYAGSAERRVRLEAALARIPATPAARTDSAPDGLAFLRASVSNALATAVATNAAPFEIPVPRSPPAPRVLPATFVLPEIPQEWRE